MKIVNDLLEPILKEALAKEQHRKDADGKEAEEEDDTLLGHLVKETKGTRSPIPSDLLTLTQIPM